VFRTPKLWSQSRLRIGMPLRMLAQNGFMRSWRAELD